ncbi:WD40 repeat domain-containing protein [Streptosporangium soli]|nr:hypothetical protein [Streptosporangium sp. KLBMP 9127]
MPSLQPTGYTSEDSVGYEAFSFGHGGTGPVMLLGDMRLRRWDRAGAPITEELAPSGFDTPKAVFSSDGRTLVVGDKGSSATALWRITGGVRQAWRTELAGGTMAVALSPDARTVAVGGPDGVVRLLDAAGGRTVGRPLTGHDAPIRAMAFHPDGKTLATVGADQTLRLWDVATQAPMRGPLTGHTNGLTAVAFSADGETVATGGVDQTVRLWDTATGRAIGPPLTGHTEKVTALAFSPAGTGLLTMGDTAGDQAATDQSSSLRWWESVPPAKSFDPLCSIIGDSLSEVEWSRHVTRVPYAKVCR